MLVRFATLEQARLDPTIKEIVILATCSQFRGWAVYEGPNTYERLVFDLRPALGTVLSPAQIDVMKNGAKSADLSESCGAAFDLSIRLVNEKGPLTGPEREDFERRIGRNSLDVLIGYCGLYAQQCIYLMGWVDPQSEGRMIRSRVTASEMVWKEDENGSARTAKQANYLMLNGVEVYGSEDSKTRETSQLPQLDESENTVL